MITRAIVEEIGENGYTAKVRIPIIDKAATDPSATSTENLSLATICTLPGISPNVRVGDVVFVEFENNDIKHPVIVGYLYRDAINGTLPTIRAMSVISNDAIIDGNFELSSIEIDEKTINNIRNSTGNLQEQIEDVKNSTIKKDDLSTENLPNTVPIRDENGTFEIGTPNGDSNPATKKYVDEAISGTGQVPSPQSTDVGKALIANGTNSFSWGVIPVAQASNNNILYGRDNNGETLYSIDSNSASMNTIVKRTTSGTIYTADPTDDGHAATKKYVDDHIASGAKQLFSTSRGSSFSTYNALQQTTIFYTADGVVATPVKNDIAYVIEDETHSSDLSLYAISNISNNSITWKYVVSFSKASFTPEQLSAINSGITSSKVSQISSNAGNIAALQSSIIGMQTSIINKVDKVSGKGLSTNDYTNADKTKVANAVTSQSLTSYRKAVDQDTIDNNKVDKVAGKGLSTNDYTNAEKSKLSGIQSGAEVNQNAFSKMQVNETVLHARAKEDTFVLKAGNNIVLTPSEGCTEVSISSSYPVVTTSKNGLMSSTDKSKLNGIASGAEVNQNAFSKVQVGESMVYADDKEDILVLKAGNNITLSLNEQCDEVEIKAQDTTYSVATESSDGLMSAADKTKLNNISPSTSNIFYVEIEDDDGNVDDQTYRKLIDDEKHVIVVYNGNYLNRSQISSNHVIFSSNRNNSAATDKSLTFICYDSTYSDPYHYSIVDNIELIIKSACSGIQIVDNEISVKQSDIDLSICNNSNSKFINEDYHDSSKQDKITSSNKLPYSLLSGTPNSYGVIRVKETDLEALTDSAIFELEEGEGITLTPNENCAAVMISASDTKVKQELSSEDCEHPVLIKGSWKSNDSPIDISKYSSKVKINPYSGNLTVTKINGTTVGSSPKFTDTTYSVATTSKNGLMAYSDKEKLNGIESGAEVNQNAFGKIFVGEDFVSAEEKNSWFRLESGANVSLSVNADESCKSVIISAQDTTYPIASESCNGLMSRADKSKLDNIETGAEKNVQADWDEQDTTSASYIKNKPRTISINDGKLSIKRNNTTIAEFTANSLTDVSANIIVPTVVSDLDDGCSYIKRNNDLIKGHVVIANNVNEVKDSGFTIGKSVPSDAKFTDTTYVDATTTASGLMSYLDKTKLNGIESGAEVNQKAFGKIVVGNINILAPAKVSSIELKAGNNVDLSVSTDCNSISISAVDTTYTSKSASSGGTDVSLVTTGEKYTWNNKVDRVEGKELSTNDYTTAEKNKLNGIQSGAEVNQNAFGKIIVFNKGSFPATIKSEALTFVEGDNITITPTEDCKSIKIDAASSQYTLPVATSSKLGGVKSGTDISVDSSGNVSVVNNSHTHTIANVTNLQSTLNGKQDTISDLQTIRSGAALGATAYQRPVNGIPAVDMSCSVQDSLALANSALQSAPVNSVNSKTGDVTITASDVGLGNVDNKSSETIRSELTKANVTNALGYTPPVNAFDRVKIGNTYLYADSKEDTLTLEAGDNIILTPNAGCDSVKISATDTKTTVTVTGSGNAITNMSASNGVITASKGSIFLTSHQSASNVNGSNIGSATQGVYINASGKPTKMAYTLSKSVPADAKFTDTTYSDVTTTAHGLMTAADKSKLNGIASGAEVNQNAFSRITIGEKTSVADTKQDTIEFKNGDNVTLTLDEGCSIVTISAKNTTYSTASESCDGLMDHLDKIKLDNLPTRLPIEEVGDGYIKYSNGVATVFGKVTLKHLTASSSADLGGNLHVWHFNCSDTVILPIVLIDTTSLNLSPKYSGYSVNLSAVVENVFPYGPPITMLQSFSGYKISDESCGTDSLTCDYIIYGKWK